LNDKRNLILKLMSIGNFLLASWNLYNFGTTGNENQLVFGIVNIALGFSILIIAKKLGEVKKIV